MTPPQVDPARAPLSPLPAPRVPPARVLVVVPAHDEEQSLPATLAEVRAKAPGVDLLVVDDGSRDGTARAAWSFSPDRYRSWICLAGPSRP